MEKGCKTTSNMQMKGRSLKTIQEEIGCRLRELREQKGYERIKDFATDYDLPIIQYWRIEKGKTNLTLRSLSRLLAIHSITIEEFFCKM